MKAKELNENMFPRPELVQAYAAVGQKYENTGHDRGYKEWFPLVTANPKLREQQITQKISQLYRFKDWQGKEWFFYDITLRGHDWKGNRKEFYYIEGRIEQMPEFEKEIDPQTEEVIPNTTQVLDMKTIYTIPFSKQKVNELSEYFTEKVSFIIIDRGTGGKRYSCTLKEFTDLAYDELISQKTGFSEYVKMRNKKYNGGN